MTEALAAWTRAVSLMNGLHLTLTTSPRMERQVERLTGRREITR